RADARRRRGAQRRDEIARQVLRLQQPRPRRIVDVVVDVGDEIGDAHDLPFDRRRAQRGRHADRRAGLALRVLGDAVAHFPREVESLAVVLELVDDAQALLVVVETAGHQRPDHALAGVAERRVAEIVSERDGLGQLLVQAQDLGDGARDLRDLERVRQPGAVVVARGCEEDLGFVLESAKGLAVDDAVTIALKGGADVVFELGAEAAARVGALGRLRREDLALAGFELLADARRASRRHRLAATARRDDTSDVVRLKPDSSPKCHLRSARSWRNPLYMKMEPTMAAPPNKDGLPLPM